MKYLSVLLLLAGAALAQPKTTCQQSPTYIYSDPGTKQSTTLFCGDMWAVAIPVSVVAEGNMEKLATAYLPDHIFTGYLPVKSHSQNVQCFKAKDGTDQCLIVTYGKTGSKHGFMYAWVTLKGVEF